MDQNKKIITCPNVNCQKKLRLPDINTRLQVTCPFCNLVFFHPSTSYDANSKKNLSVEKWYRSNWFTISMLLLLPFIGIILFWSHPRYSKRKKIGLTTVGIFLIVLLNMFDYQDDEKDLSFAPIYLQRISTLTDSIALKFVNGNGTQEKSRAEIYEKASPSVVSIMAFNENEQEEGQGTGFIIGSDGFIVTNWHVLSGAHSIEIELLNGDKYKTASLVLEDKNKDICVIKIDAKGLSVLPLGNSERVRVGQEIITIGAPLGLGIQLTPGDISAIREGEFQFTAPVSPGSSGSPVFDKKGAVVGIVTKQIPSWIAQNINFAIPVNSLVELIEANKTKVSEEPTQKVYEVQKPQPYVFRASKPEPNLFEDLVLHERTPVSLETGTDIIPPRETIGLGQLVVSNGTKLDGVIMLISYSEPRQRVRAVYVRAKDKVRLENISKGKYICRFALGTDWDKNTRKFLQNNSYSEFVDPFEYVETEKAKEVEYTILEITLHPVIGGAAETTNVNEQDFYEFWDFDNEQ
jgi:S1-C subfamily serine protease